MIDRSLGHRTPMLHREQTIVLQIAYASGGTITVPSTIAAAPALVELQADRLLQPGRRQAPGGTQTFRLTDLGFRIATILFTPCAFDEDARASMRH